MSCRSRYNFRLLARIQKKITFDGKYVANKISLLPARSLRLLNLKKVLWLDFFSIKLVFVVAIVLYG